MASGGDGTSVDSLGGPGAKTIDCANEKFPTQAGSGENQDISSGSNLSRRTSTPFIDKAEYLKKQTKTTLHKAFLEEMVTHIESMNKEDYDEFRKGFKSRRGLDAITWKSAETAKELMRALDSKNVIREGEYNELITVCTQLNFKALANVVDEYKAKIILAVEKEEIMEAVYPIPKDGTKGLLVVFNQFTKNESEKLRDLVGPTRAERLLRPGTLQDEKNLISLFEGKFKFKTKRLADLTKEEILKNINEIRTDIEEKKYHQLFVVMLSHGDREGALTFPAKKEEALSLKLTAIQKDLSNTETNLGDIQTKLAALLKLEKMTGSLSSYFQKLRKDAEMHLAKQSLTFMEAWEDLFESLNEEPVHGEASPKDARTEAIDAFETLINEVMKCEHNPYDNGASVIKSQVMHEFWRLMNVVEGNVQNEENDDVKKENENRKEVLSGLVSLLDEHYDRISGEAIAREFYADRSPSLACKPKVIMIQACRGDLFQPVTSIEADVGSDDTHTDREGGGSKKTIAADMDILISYSQTQGNKAFRDPSAGSWYINAIDFVFTKYYKSKHVLDMMTMVTDRIARRECKGSHQTACHTSTLSKQLYINGV